MKTYAALQASLPVDAELSATFGYPGEGGYVEYWRQADGQRYIVTNGPWHAHPMNFDWQVQPVGIGGVLFGTRWWPCELRHSWLWHGMFQPFEDASPIEILMADFACWSIA